MQVFRKMNYVHHALGIGLLSLVLTSGCSSGYSTPMPQATQPAPAVQSDPMYDAFHRVYDCRTALESHKAGGGTANSFNMGNSLNIGLAMKQPLGPAFSNPNFHSEPGSGMLEVNMTFKYPVSEETLRKAREAADASSACTPVTG